MLPYQNSPIEGQLIYLDVIIKAYLRQTKFPIIYYMKDLPQTRICTYHNFKNYSGVTSMISISPMNNPLSQTHKQFLHFFFLSYNSRESTM